MIQLNNLEKSYPAGASDFETIMGPAGAGRSTLLAILEMLDCKRGRRMHTVIRQESIMEIPVECASYAPYLWKFARVQ